MSFTPLRLPGATMVPVPCLTAQYSKFFGTPGNARPAPQQQTKLSFATKATTSNGDGSSSSKENVSPEKGMFRGSNGSPYIKGNG